MYYYLRTIYVAMKLNGIEFKTKPNGVEFWCTVTKRKDS